MPLPLMGTGVAQFGHADSPALRAAPQAVQVSEMLGVIRVDRKHARFNGDRNYGLRYKNADDKALLTPA